MRQRDARSALQGDAISSGGQLPVPPALCPHGGDTQIPTLPLCLCMCDGFSIAHRRENARIIAEAPPVAEKARRFRGSVPVFTPQRGWKPADTTVFRIAEAPPVAYFSQQFFLFVSDGILFVNSDKKYAKNAARNRWFLDFLSSQELRSLWAVKGIDCATNPLPLPLR